MNTFIITCEHGGNRVPAPYRRLFRGQRALLDSHRGYDPGSLVMAKALASAFGAPLVASTVSRLLIDLNRSISHPQLFSAVTRAAPAQTRAQIVEQHYRPYRRQVERLVHQRGAGAPVVSVTSPVGQGRPRCAPAGRQHWWRWLRNFAYAAITPMPAKETG